MTAAIEDLHTVRSGRLKWSDDFALDSIDALDMVGMLEARLGIEVRGARRGSESDSDRSRCG
jgi:hypothetical protein